MRIQKDFERILGKWQVVFRRGPDWARHQAYTIEFSVLNFHQIAERGYLNPSSNYKGFYFRMTFCYGDAALLSLVYTTRMLVRKFPLIPSVSFSTQF